MSNSEIQSRVRSNLDKELEIKDSHLLVDTDADGRRVVISGTVTSEEIRNRTMNLARTSVPGITVVDQIQVQPHEMARTDAPTNALKKPAANNRKSRR